MAIDGRRRVPDDQIHPAALEAAKGSRLVPVWDPTLKAVVWAEDLPPHPVRCPRGHLFRAPNITSTWRHCHAQCGQPGGGHRVWICLTGHCRAEWWDTLHDPANGAIPNVAAYAPSVR